MIGKNENSNVRRGKWLSLLKCIILNHFPRVKYICLFKLYPIFYSVGVLSTFWLTCFCLCWGKKEGEGEGGWHWILFVIIGPNWLLFWTSRADAHKQQQLLQQQQEDSGSAPVPTDGRGTTSLAVQDQRKTLKFGFSSKGGTSKVCLPSLSIYLESYVPNWIQGLGRCTSRGFANFDIKIFDFYIWPGNLVMLLVLGTMGYGWIWGWPQRPL